MGAIRASEEYDMRFREYLYVVFAGLLIACGPSVSDGNFGDGGLDPLCGTGCPDDQVCVTGLGCRDCYPGLNVCTEDNEVHVCNADGMGTTFVEDCDGEACFNGSCMSACEAAEQDPSNVGCHFYAVDLDNEAVVTLGIENDAAKQQFAIAVANVNDYPVKVDVFKNVARFGQPVQEELVETRTIPADDLVQINLPQREVDGTMGQNGPYVRSSGSGTFVSSHAFRIQSDAPVVAYQFQPIIQQFSNDASILIPRQALGENYFVMGWPTANFCGSPPGDPLHQESIPDHTSITIIGVHEATEVTVYPTHPIKASGGDSGLVIPQTPRGQPLTFTVGPYDVVNLESDQPMVGIAECFSHIDQDGDFTGTQVTSTKPVVVFSSNERGIGYGGADVPDPPGWDGESCCTDHLEQQMFPVEALGWKFAVSRSPVRSTDPSYEEPDIYRVMATVNNTTITTNVPGNASFTLNAGEFRTFHAYNGFILESTGGAVMVGQFLVSQQTIPQGGIGDPTFIVFPAAAQHRDKYTFLIPTSFEDNYMVVTMPDDATVIVDGMNEFGPNCVERAIGMLDGVNYKQQTCKLDEGVHKITATKPVGLTVYGYYNVGSYGYPGGSDVKLINPID